MTYRDSRSALFTDPLLATVKNKEPAAQQPDLRPIVSGNYHVKVGATYVLDIISEPLEKICDPIQMAVGARGGSEKAIHRLRVGLTRSTNSILFAGDFHRAYQEIDRAGMLQEIYSHETLSPAWRLFDMCYGSEESDPQLVMFGQGGEPLDYCDSSDGVRQGCKLGPAGFGIGTIRLYKQVIKDLKDIDTAAILDDFNTAGDPDSVFESFDRLSKLSGPATGLRLNMEKTHIFWPRTTPVPEDIRDAAKKRGLRVVTGSDPCLGSLISNEKEAIEAYMLKKVKKHDRFFNLLEHPEMPKQVAKIILKEAATPRMVHIARTMEPTREVIEGLHSFDKKVNIAYQRLRKRGRTDELTPDFITSQPTKGGGDGIRELATLAPLSYLASVAANVPQLDGTIPPPYKEKIDALLSQIQETAPEAHKLFEGFWEKFKDIKESYHLQRRLTRIVEATKQRDFLKGRAARDCTGNVGQQEVWG
eukprot:Lithocolla_globosa_v1_NODE_771_length_3306_cov_79.432482.p1 type:complete len:475 gc:universal NODE_771_length_3306_cov_79.432482:1532-2956(+)